MRLNVPSTKSNLLRLKEDFGFVKAGHDLLDQKREVLLEELVEIYRDAGQLRRRLESHLKDVYAALREALLTGGHTLLEREALASADAQELRARERSVMGVIVPLLEFNATDLPVPLTAPGYAAPGAAAVRRRIRDLLPDLVRLAEIEVSCRRLAVELQRTQRKVNALENIFIPQCRDTIRFIEISLEEREREALFHLKRLKSRRGRGIAEA